MLDQADRYKYCEVCMGATSCPDRGRTDVNTNLCYVLDDEEVDRRAGPDRLPWLPGYVTRRMLWTTLCMFLRCRNETDFIAALDVWKECADDAIEHTIDPRCPVIRLQHLVSTACELTIVYFPW